MPELFRDIASRLREFVGNRRRAPRYPVRLGVSVLLLDAKQRAYPTAIEGHTRDVSSSGLALILRAIRIGDRYITGDSNILHITLSLPSSSVELLGVPVRYERLSDDDEENGYVIGVRISEISERDRALFDEYRTKANKG